LGLSAVPSRLLFLDTTPAQSYSLSLHDALPILPEMDGLTAIRELVRRSCECKVLVLTMHKTEEHIRAALQAGANGYLLKDASRRDRKSTRLNSSHVKISYAVFCLKKKSRGAVLR